MREGVSNCDSSQVTGRRGTLEAVEQVAIVHRDDGMQLRLQLVHGGRAGPHLVGAGTPHRYDTRRRLRCPLYSAYNTMNKRCPFCST